MRKKVLIFIISVVIILLILGVLFTLFIVNRNNMITLKEKEKTIEYGNTYNPTLEDLIDLNLFDFIDNTKVNIESNIIGDGEYPNIGTYQIYVYYQNIQLTQEVKVIDTTAPEIIMQETIEIDQGTDLNEFDFNNYITATDLSQINELKIDYSNVNTSEPGEYLCSVLVQDIYDNEAKKDFNIIVIEIIEEYEVENDTEASEEQNVNTNTNVSTSSSTTNTKTTKDNTNNTTKSSSSNSNKTSSSQKTETSSNAETSNTTTNNNTSNWCIDGGNEHLAGDGENEHGYFSTWDQAYSAFEKYTSTWNSVQFKISQCACGLYYFWAIQ